MRLDEVYQRSINWPSQRVLIVAIAIAACLIIFGLLLSFSKRAWLGRCVGFLGLCVIMLGLFDLYEQTTTEKVTEMITITRYRRTESIRWLLLSAIALLPCVGLAVMWLGAVQTRYRQRGQVPRHLKAGRRHFAQKEYEAALREYNQAIHAAPHLAQGYCRRGALFHEMGQLAHAMSDFDSAIACDPRYAPAYLERGKQRSESGDFDGALADFGKLMAMRANDPEAYLNRGICLTKKGLMSDAVADFRRVLKLTNHTDFAEPAKNYLRQIEDGSARMPLPQTNGAPLLPTSSQPQAQDHAF